MKLDIVWSRYQQGGYAAVSDDLSAGVPPDALTQFYLALIAFSHDDLPRALAHAQAAASAAPDHPVYVQGAAYLQRVASQGKAHVYVEGDAFAAFIREGGNVTLYDSTSRALRAIYESYEALTLLDIGVGDGLALLPALTSNVSALDLVEPSGAMLSRTSARLDARQIAHRPFEGTVQAFMQHPAPRWDVIQATWSLQSIPPEERPAVFAWLRTHGQRVVIAEFDVPVFEALLSPDRTQYIISRYVNGLQEYGDNLALVAQGFLMPVMFGYFDRSAARTNWEGPIVEWRDALHAAGFTQISLSKLMAYFWADAYLIDAV